MNPDYLVRFSPHHTMEIRVICGREVKRWWGTPAAFTSYTSALTTLNATGFNIFVGVNPRSAHASDSSTIREVVAFHADVDDGRVASQQKPTEKNGNRAAPPSPSMIVASGHGRHLYWHLAEPIVVTSDNRALLQAINRGLAQAVYGDAACCDLARVLRLPGFVNHKPPAAPVCLIRSNSLRYTLADFMPFAVGGTLPRHSMQPRPDGVTVMPPSAELTERFRQARLRTPQMARAWRGEVGDGSSDSRYALVGDLRRTGFSDGEVLAIVCSRRWWNRHTRQHRSSEHVARDVSRVLAKRGVARG